MGCAFDWMIGLGDQGITERLTELAEILIAAVLQDESKHGQEVHFLHCPQRLHCLQHDTAHPMLIRRGQQIDRLSVTENEGEEIASIVEILVQKGLLCEDDERLFVTSQLCSNVHHRICIHSNILQNSAQVRAIVTSITIAEVINALVIIQQ